MNIMVTGGAGYIGSHAVKKFLKSGHRVVVWDNLSHGHQAAIDPRAEFIQGDIEDLGGLSYALKENNIEAVIHFAAFIEVGESVVEPGKYFKNNFSNGLKLLGAMRNTGVQKLVFSSTAAVYGNPDVSPIPETHSTNPINPYGRSKLMMEWAIEDYARAHGIGAVALRYFNVAGASPDGTIGEAHEPESHLIPKILSAATGDAPAAAIFGTDYPTRDGSCIRDYVHVVDLADAHEKALHKIEFGQRKVYNLGSERGFSVKEVIEACRKITGKNFEVRMEARRPGDPATLVASSQKARTELGWNPEFTNIETIVTHAWQWQKNGLPLWKKSSP
jgi:UDP-glucose 4-epimerase